MRKFNVLKYYMSSKSFFNQMLRPNPEGFVCENRKELRKRG